MSKIKQLVERMMTYEYTAKILPGAHFPVRSTFLELANQELMIISPGPFEAHFIQPIIAKYKQVYCVAPNAFHHMHLQQFHRRFPEVAIYGPRALVKKQPWLSNHLSSLSSLEKTLKAQVTFLPIAGNPTLSETVFYYQPTKTLIMTDLIFNMREPMPKGRRWLLTLAGVRNKIGQSKLIKYTIKDHRAYADSIKAILGLECERIIIGHGNIIEGQIDIQKAFEVLEQSST